VEQWLKEMCEQLADGVGTGIEPIRTTLASGEQTDERTGRKRIQMPSVSCGPSSSGCRRQCQPK